MSVRQPHEGSAICGAKTRAGHPCKNTPLENGRCYLHGGLTPKGIASPHFKTGRHSKYLPQGLLSRYSDAMADERLLEQRGEIALLDVRLSQLLSTIDAGVSGEIWRELEEAWSSFNIAYQTKDVDAQTVHLNNIGRLISAGGRETKAWEEIQTTLENRRRIVESERKRYIEAQEYLTLQQTMVLFARLQDIIAENVTDRNTLHTISQELVRLSASVDG